MLTIQILINANKNRAEDIRQQVRGEGGSRSAVGEMGRTF